MDVLDGSPGGKSPCGIHSADHPECNAFDDPVQPNSANPWSPVGLELDARFKSLSQDITHVTGLNHGGRFSRADAADEEDLTARFQFGKAPPKPPVTNRTGLARVQHGTFESTPMPSVETSVDCGRQVPARSLEYLGNLTSTGFHAPDGSSNDTGQGSTSPQAAPAVRDKSTGITDDPHPSTEQQTSSAKRTAGDNLGASPWGKRPRTDIVDDSQEIPMCEPRSRLVSNSPNRISSSGSIQSSTESQHQDKGASARPDRSRGQHVSTPFQLPKSIKISRERALLRSSPRHHQKSQKKLPRSSGQLKQMKPKDVFGPVQTSGRKNMAPPPHPSKSGSRHRNLGGDLTFSRSSRDHSVGPRVVSQASGGGKGHDKHQSRNVRSPSQNAETVRPGSQASNISRPRKPATDSFALPSSPDRKMYYQQFGSLTSAWNEFFTFEQEYRARYEKGMSSLADELEQKDEEIQTCYEEIEACKDDIDSLTAKNNELATSSHDLDKALREKEQQHARSEEKYKEVMVQLSEEQTQRESAERELSASNMARAEIQTRLTSVTEESHRFQTAVVTLQTKLEEREKEVTREKEHVNGLKSLLEKSQSLCGQQIQSVIASGRQLLEYSGQNGDKLNKLLDMLDIVKSRTDPEGLADKLRAFMTDAVTTLMPSSPDFELSVDDVQKLTENVDSVRSLAEGIHEKLCSTEAASDWQDRFHEANTQAGLQEGHIQQLQGEVEEAKTTAQAQWEENQQYRQVLLNLETEIQANGITAEKYSYDIKNLEESIAGKNQELSALNDKLKQANDQLVSQAHGMQQEQAQRDTQEKEWRDDLVRLQAANDKMRTVQKENEKLTRDLRTAEAQRESLRPGHEEWSRTRIEIVQVRQILGELMRSESATDIDDKLQQLINLGAKLSRKLGDPEQGRLNAGPRYSTRQRQIQLKLPESTDEASNMPISIEQERATRRQQGAVQSIMKTIIRKELANTDPDEQAKTPSLETPSAAQSTHTGAAAKPSTRRKSQATGNAHGMFNQRVVGAVSAGVKGSKHDGRAAACESTAQSQTLGNGLARTDDDKVPQPPKKRKRNPTDAKPGPREDRRASSYFNGPGELAASQPNDKPVEIPIKRALITYGSQRSLSQHDTSQESTTSSATIQSTDSKHFHNKASRRRRSSSSENLPLVQVETMGELDLFEDL